MHRSTSHFRRSPSDCIVKTSRKRKTQIQPAIAMNFTHHSEQSPWRRSARRGFALIVTITMMVLLSVLGVGLLSLGGVALRASSGSENRAIAQANARMALSVAIGELQRLSGPDTRITAAGGILGE